jgi:hypothetical protein
MGVLAYPNFLSSTPNEELHAVVAKKSKKSKDELITV